MTRTPALLLAERVLEQSLRAALLWLGGRPKIGRWVREHHLGRRVVGRFVAGETLPEALRHLRELQRAGFHATVDLLGEGVRTPESVRATADAYVDLVGTLAAQGLDANVSLKLTALGLDLDALLCRRELVRVLDAAKSAQAFVRVDMEDHRHTDRTLDLVTDLHQNYPRLGAVVQAYLRRSAGDLGRLIAAGVPVRLCKGAYREPAEVAFESRAEVTASYLGLMERLLASGVPTALATHDPAIIARARARAVPSLEFEMLYGIRRDLQRALLGAGLRVRLYVPYGPDWYPYFMRRLAERPANLAFVVASLIKDRPE